MDFEGIIPPMLTPTTGRTGDVDVDALATYADFLLDGGVHGLFPCGSTGEFSSLTREQRATVVETVADRAGDAPVLAGCSDTSIDGVLAHIDDATAAGADAAVVVTPYYLTTTQDGFAAFYEAVADRSPLPVVLYNIPSLTGQSLAPETAGRLAEHSNVVGLKDSTFDLSYHHGVLSATPDSFTVLQGTSGLAVSALDLGADGATPGTANVFPGVMTSVYESYRAGDRDRAVELMNDVVHPVITTTGSMPTAAAFKHLLELAGHHAGPPLVPLPELTADERAAIERCYERVAEHAE